MKIVTIGNLPPPFGGAESFARSLALFLQKSGEMVAVVTHRIFQIQMFEDKGLREYSLDLDEQLMLREQDIKIYPAFNSSLTNACEQSKHHKIDTQCVCKLQEILKAEKADILHCHFTTGKIREATEASRIMNIPLVATLHGMTDLVPKYDSFILNNISSEEVLSLLRSISRVVVVSHPMLKYCQSQGIERVVRIPGGIDTEYFSDDNNGTSRKGILYVGKLNRHKGLKEAVEAFLKVEKNIADHLDLVGRGVCREVFEKTSFFLNNNNAERARELIWAGKIRLHEELLPHALRDLYRQSRVLVLPSLTEGFPLVILEALACRTPVIASDVGSVSKVIQNGRNGYLIPKGDSEALASSILKVINNHDGDFKEHCLERVKKYDIRKITRAYQEMFRATLMENNVNA